MEMKMNMNMNIKTSMLSLTGMLLSQAREILALEGISEYEVVVTGPPRLTDRTVEDHFRVLRVHWDLSPVQVLVCKP